MFLKCLNHKQYYSNWQYMLKTNLLVTTLFIDLFLSIMLLQEWFIITKLFKETKKEYWI